MLEIRERVLLKMMLCEFVSFANAEVFIVSQVISFTITVLSFIWVQGDTKASELRNIFLLYAARTKPARVIVVDGRCA